MKIQTNNSKTRCPRCDGFLYSAAYVNRRYFHTLKDKVSCINCARMWRRENGVMVVWPERNENIVIEADLEAVFRPSQKRTSRRRL